MRNWTLVLVLALAPVPIAVGAEPDPSLERIQKDIDFLAGEECEGRGLKTKGIVKAGDYIATAFKDSGLKPAFQDGSYFQKFVVPGRGKIGTPNALALNHGDIETVLKIKVQRVNNDKVAKRDAFKAHATPSFQWSFLRSVSK